MSKRLDELNRQMNTIITEKQAREKREQRKMGSFEWGSLLFGVGVFVVYNIPAFSPSWYSILPGIMGLRDWVSVAPFVVGFLLACFFPEVKISIPLLFVGVVAFLWVSIKAAWFLQRGWITLYVIAMALLCIGATLFLKYYYDKKMKNRK